MDKEATEEIELKKINGKRTQYGVFLFIGLLMLLDVVTGHYIVVLIGGVFGATAVGVLATLTGGTWFLFLIGAIVTKIQLNKLVAMGDKRNAK